MTAWKDLERRICVALGGRRSGPLGAAVSDCVGVPFAVEVKRSTSLAGPPVRSAWIQQARTNAVREGKPWILVVAGHNDRRPIVTLDFWAFAELAQKAGVIPTPVELSEEGGPGEPVSAEGILNQSPAALLTELPTTAAKGKR